MDPITDVFTSMRVAGAVYGSIEATAPWGISGDAGPYTKFGMVVRGSCWLTVDGFAQPVRLKACDCFLLPRGSAHSLQDDLRTPTRSFCEILRTRECERGRVLHYGGGGEPATVIMGKFFFDHPGTHPLRDSLPPLIHIPGDQSQHGALQTTLHALVAEITTQDLGSEVVVNRLADILFIQAIRAHIATCGAAQTGWLRALADPQIGFAIRAIHENVAQPWTVASLAAEARMSRSAFALRFKDLVGDTPLEYITRWRMCKASSLLRESDKKLIDVANLVGYDSDGAFKRAFKRVIGITPGEYRHESLSSFTSHFRSLETVAVSNWEEAGRDELLQA